MIALQACTQCARAEKVLRVEETQRKINMENRQRYSEIMMLELQQITEQKVRWKND